MGNDAHTPSIPPVSRRAMIGGLAAGAGALGLGLAAKPAAAAPAEADPFAPVAGLAPVRNGTALQEGLSYIHYTGYDFRPLTSSQTWTTNGGGFNFLTTVTQGYCSLAHNLPVGSVLREFEVYGTTTATSGGSVRIWTLDTTTGAINNPVTVALPANTANFTVTATMDIEITPTLAVTPFVFINDSADASTDLYGARLGFEPVVQTPSFVPISPIPRPYNTRDTAGLTKLNPGEERTITLPVPAGVSAAVIQLTVTETGAGGFVGVFPADAASWPGNSSINWSSVNENVGGTVITAVSADGKIKLRGGGSPTHVIIDVPGYLQ